MTYHQNITSISPVYHQLITSIPPVHHQCITSISPVYHQYVTSISPVCHRLSLVHVLTLIEFGPYAYWVRSLRLLTSRDLSHFTSLISVVFYRFGMAHTTFLVLKLIELVLTGIELLLTLIEYGPYGYWVCRPWLIWVGMVVLCKTSILHCFFQQSRSLRFFCPLAGPYAY